MLECRPYLSNDQSLWDGFCDTSGDAWFWQTTAFLHYQTAYAPAYKTVPKHLLFFQDGKLVALCPLAVEQSPTSPHKTFSLGGDPLPVPVLSTTLSESERESIRRHILEYLDTLAVQEGVAKISFRQSILAPHLLYATYPLVNDWVSNNFLDISMQTRLIDLRVEERTLWSQVRKSYHSLINKTAKHFNFRFLDQHSITPAYFGAYRDLHQKAAGRVTRPADTFEAMHEWIRKGFAFLVLAEHENVISACALLIHYKNQVFYASACNDPDLENEWSLGHFLQWNVIQTLKTRGIEHYDLASWPMTPQWSFVPTPEEKHISFFKSGFGGRPAPLFRSEKFYSSEVFEKEYTARMKRLLQV